MASLNTLRTKFGVVLTIFIVVALLAFIWGLKADLGFSNRDPKVGEMDGKSISYTEYFNEYNQIKQNNQIDESSDEALEQLASATWQSLLSKLVVMPGFEKLGINVSAAERAAMINGDQPSQTLMSLFADPATGAYDINAIAQVLQAAQTNPEVAAQWAVLNNQMINERQFTKFATLLARGVFANSLEVNNGVANATKNYTGRLVSKNYATVADSLVSVSDSEISKYYNAHKDAFKKQASRSISYVRFDIEPTPKDIADIQAKATQLGSEFAAAENATAFVRSNQGKVAQNYVTAAQLGADEAEKLTAGETFGATLNNNIWRMSRVADQITAPDSIGLQRLVLLSNQTETIDSLMAAAKGGADFSMMVFSNTMEEQDKPTAGMLSTYPFSSFNGEFVEMFKNAKTGDIVKSDNGQATIIFKVTKATKPVEQYKVASIEIPVEASQATTTRIYSDAGSFINNAKAKEFKTAADTAKVTPRVASIATSQHQVPGLTASRDIVKWAYTADKGDVSEAFKVGNSYIVATLTEINNETTQSLAEVREQIRSRLVNEKKYDYIVATIEGNTFEEQAASLGSEPTEFSELNYAAYNLPGLGFDFRTIGAITTSEAGVVSKPIKGAQAVVVFVVDSIENNKKQTPSAEKVRQQSAAEQAIQQSSMQAIQELSEVEDLRNEYI